MTTENTEGGAMEQQIDVDDFLAHFGVKGMKWGQRKARTSGGSSKSAFKRDGTITKDELKAAGKIAVKYGAVPAAVAFGATVGLPYTPVLGIAARALQDPAVQDLMAPAGKFVKSVAGEFGDVKLPDLPKFESPFGVKTTSGPSTVKFPQYIDGEYPFHERNGDIVPNPDYVGKK